MATSSANLRSIYRSLLRELPPRPILATPRSNVHLRIRDSFANSTAAADSTTANEVRTRAAEQAIRYLRSQRLYVTLVERYNPGMGMDQEERIRLTARRVGMDLPEEFKNRMKEAVRSAARKAIQQGETFQIWGGEGEYARKHGEDTIV